MKVNEHEIKPQANLRYADLHGADLQGADLRYADLQNANLQNADLTGANLTGANLTDANLQNADLTDANLQNANLTDANLRYANLRHTTLNWQSHTLIAEILRQSAGENAELRSVAGLVAVSLDWCWARFAKKLTPLQKDWARSVLRPFIKEDDDVPPELECPSSS